VKKGRGEENIVGTNLLVVVGGTQ